MNESEAISRARHFLEQRKHAPVRWGKARGALFTKEALLAGLQREDFSRKAEVEASITESGCRSHWTVDFPLIVPDGEVWSPDSIAVRVYADTAECEIEMQL
jgi:hypothetical protein